MKLSHLFLSILFISLSTIVFGQLTPQEAVEQMGRGINLGNTLEPPFESGWNNGPAEESYFDAYIDAGFTNIRIPVRWDKHTGNSAPYAINETWMNRVEEVVDWGLSRGLLITLNGHHEDWLKNNYNNANLRDRYDAIWLQISERFKDKSDSLLFEIINEPNGMTVGQVDDLNERILGIIRETNPTRIVIYGGNMYANSEQLLDAKILDDDYIIGYYHAYDPWQFSGQGMGTWGTNNDYQQITNKYNTVKNWSDNNNIPIHHSEFGAVHTCDFNSRMRIYAHNTELCMVNGFAFSVWDDGGDFKVLERSTNTWPGVKDILVHYHADSPNQIFSSMTTTPATEQLAVLVEWNNRTTDNGDITIERSAASTSNFVVVSTLPSDATSYIDPDITPGNTYTYRMYTTRTDGTLLHGYPTRIKVNATEQAPFNELPINIPGVIEVEEYDFGGEGIAYHDNDAVNISNGFRFDEGVDIGAYNGGYILGYVEQNEWIEYTVNVEIAGVYSVVSEIASEIANGTFSLDFQKNNASTTFSVPSTGGWVAFQELAANNTIELEAGKQIMRLNITNSNAFNVDNITFTLESSSSVENSEYNILISPNPTDGFLTIELPENTSKNKGILYNVAGEKVGEFILNNTSTSIDLSNYKSGMYMLHIVNDHMNIVRRIIKQ